MPDDFEKTGAISELLLEVRERAQGYFDRKWQHVFFIGLLLRTCEVAVISVVKFLAEILKDKDNQLSAMLFYGQIYFGDAKEEKTV